MFESVFQSIGRAYAKVTGWHPEGTTVALRVMEGEAGFCGSTVTGTIVAVDSSPLLLDRHTAAPILVRLDSRWSYAGRTTSQTEWILAIPLSSGNAVYQLPVGSIVAHIFPASGHDFPRDVQWNDMIAICEISRKPTHE